MYVYVDTAGRIEAFNPNDMSGNTGWENVPETVSEPLFEEHGVPIYKYSDGHAVSRTAEEIAADIPEPAQPEPTANEILDVLLGVSE